MATVWAIKSVDGATSYATLDDSGNLTISGVLASTGVDDFGSGGIKADVIAESTAATGVTIDGLLLKDGFVVATDSQGVKLGTGVDDTLKHDGTNSSWAHTTGNLTIDNQAATGATFLDLGTNNANTKVAIRTDAGVEVLTASGDGIVTVTDGVASGTARRVGGKISALVADATLTDAAGGGDGAETVIATITIPANTIKSGTKLRVDAAWVVTTGTTVETLTMRLRLGGVGGTVIASTADVDPGTGSGSLYAMLVGHAAAGGAAEIAHFGVAKSFAAAGSDSTILQQGPTLTNFATNGALTLVITGDWGVAEAAGGDVVTLRIFEADIYG